MDPRLTLARPDLAAADLQGLQAAPAYRATVRRQCIVPVADLRRAPDALAEQDDQLLFGELFEVLDETAGYAWGRVVRDGYVGYLPLAALGPPGEAPTHRICALRAFAFSEPDFKSAAVGPYALNALVRIEAEEGRYRKAAGAGWFAQQHLAPIGTLETDPAAIAEQFVGAPYRWGGRDGLGIDCSGLIQQSLFACGLGCPRDADQQAGLGEPVEPAALRRADLVFWPGHVAMMLDETRLIHANSFHMACAIEPLAAALARIDAPPIGFKRVWPA
jgi:hypothetical protein